MSPLTIVDRPSPNFDARAQPVDLVVLHYTGMQDAETALRRLTDPAPVAGAYPGPWQDGSLAADAPLARVSTHYVIDEGGVIYRVVAEEERAWHAGVSSWERKGDVNSRAIGIEIVNGGHDFGLPDYPEAQIAALIALLQEVLARRNLHPARVVGHSDIAPARKLDPGEKFPWRRLADAGVSIWPKHLPAADEEDHNALLRARLRRIGYDVSTDTPEEALASVLAAFQRRFRPQRIDGAADAETRKLVAAVAALTR